MATEMLADVLDDAVSLGASTLHGTGVFLREAREAKEGQILFIEGGKDVVFAPCVMDVASAAVPSNVSSAWPIVTRLMDMPPEGRPAWVDQLARCKPLARSILKEEGEEAMLREMMRRYKDCNVVDLFTSVVSNHFCAEGPTGLSLASLGRRSSRVNHSREHANVYNVIVCDPCNATEMKLAWVAKCYIAPGSELLLDYGEDHSKHFEH